MTSDDSWMELIKSYDDIPLLPMQIAIQKDLALIFDILDPKTGMKIEDFLEPPGNGTRQTRANLVTIMQKAIQDPTTNHQHRNLFRRHQGILHWLFQSGQLETLLGMKKTGRRIMLGKIIGMMDTEENKIRQRIFQGNYIYTGRNQQATGGNQ